MCSCLRIAELQARAWRFRPVQNCSQRLPQSLSATSEIRR
jgi:hypothetical protein